jgi:hypothetical protein
MIGMVRTSSGVPQEEQGRKWGRICVAPQVLGIIGLFGVEAALIEAQPALQRKDGGYPPNSNPDHER